MTSKQQFTIAFRLHLDGADDWDPGWPVKGYKYFEGGAATVHAAECAPTDEHADDILRRSYKGAGLTPDGVGGWVEWKIERVGREDA